MAKVVLICGKICCGKSTYAQKLCRERKAVLLSIDEIMLALFGQYVGEKHDEYVQRTETYLFEKSVELLQTGIDVVLDWGFWTQEERAFAKDFYAARNIPHEFHYIDIDDATWRARIDKRNRTLSQGATNAYFVDDNLAAKFDALFERPQEDEIDLWIPAEGAQP